MRAYWLLAAVFTTLSIAACATDQGNYWEMHAVEDADQLDVSFSADELAFTRIEAARNRSREGWIESGTWQADIENGKSTVWIYIATLYEKAFMKKDIRPMQDMARRFSGDSYLEFGDDGSVRSNSGDIDYVFYRASGQPCVMIRKYWTDAELGADVLRAIALEWVAGTHLLYAYHCKSAGDDLEMHDMTLLFDGIDARDLVWPNDMFVSSDEAY